MPLTIPTGSAGTVTATAAARRPINWGRVLTILLFLAPALVLYTMFVLYPIVQAAHYSAYDWNGLGPLTKWVGFANYRRVLADPIFRAAVGHNLIIAGLSLLLQLPMALALALLVGRKLPGKTFFRTVFFLPYVLADVATAVMWRAIYNPRSGLVNAFFNLIGVPPQSWLSDPKVALYAIFVAITWKYFGYHLVLYMAGLQNIPVELEEAALIDGCNGWQATRYVTLPLLGSTIRLTIYLSVVGSLQFFDLIWVMTTGGPVNATETMVTYLYKYGFQRFNLGYGSAVAVVLFAICLTFSLLYQKFVMKRDISAARVAD